MKSLLILRHLKVENANAIAGMTYGFPAMTHFLGFTHALSRKLEAAHGLRLGGCAVVCHRHQLLTHRSSAYADTVFSLSRNPVLKDGSSSSFVEEGKMHLQLTLILECEFDKDDLNFGGDSIDQDIAFLTDWVSKTAATQRLAGGVITGMGSVEYNMPEQEDKAQRKLMLSLLPGFALTEKSSALQQHWAALREQTADTEMLDAWLDFFSIRYACRLESNPTEPEKETLVWEQIPRPAGGWLVPLMLGYKAISTLYDNADVNDTRDAETPFRLTEPVYSVGEWLSPHRVGHIEELLWRYQHQGDWYLCKNEINAE